MFGSDWMWYEQVIPHIKHNLSKEISKNISWSKLLKNQQKTSILKDLRNHYKNIVNNPNNKPLKNKMLFQYFVVINLIGEQNKF